jgi:predicted transposase YbfD/YdcC
VIAVDGKTLRGSKKSANGSGALHLLSAYACEAGLVIGQRAVDGKCNEIKAIPELLDMLAIKGAIVSIDAMGTQKAIAAKIAAQEADYVLALKGNQSTLHDDVKSFFADAELAKTCAVHRTTDTGHGRIEERTCRATDAIGWLKERHPGWQNLHGIAAIRSKRSNASHRRAWSLGSGGWSRRFRHRRSSAARPDAIRRKGHRPARWRSVCANGPPYADCRSRAVPR